MVYGSIMTIQIITMWALDGVQEEDKALGEQVAVSFSHYGVGNDYIDHGATWFLWTVLKRVQRIKEKQNCECPTVSG